MLDAELNNSYKDQRNMLDLTRRKLFGLLALIPFWPKSSNASTRPSEEPYAVLVRYKSGKTDNYWHAPAALEPEWREELFTQDDQTLYKEQLKNPQDRAYKFASLLAQVKDVSYDIQLIKLYTKPDPNPPVYIKQGQWVLR